jgi:hypothetical protein
VSNDYDLFGGMEISFPISISTREFQPFEHHFISRSAAIRSAAIQSNILNIISSLNEPNASLSEPNTSLNQPNESTEENLNDSIQKLKKMKAKIISTQKEKNDLKLYAEQKRMHQQLKFEQRRNRNMARR